MSSNKNPLVSIVIVNWNGLEDTKLCLKHTSKQTYKNIEIIVVDNGSDDGSKQYLSDLKDIIYVNNEKNLGFTGGHIAGYRSSSGEYILLLNNDAVMDYDYINKSVKLMMKDVQIGAIGGKSYFWNDKYPLLDTNNPFYTFQNINAITAEAIFENKERGILREVNNLSGSCVMVRRSVIEEIGYLHNPFFTYYEESDLFARMKRGGYKVIYSPDLAIWHLNGKSSQKKGSSFTFYMLMKNRYRFAVRNFDNWSLRRFLKFYFINGLICSFKCLLPLNNNGINKAYAKAFWVNFLFGWRAYIERVGLKKKFGKSNYNELIAREQKVVSLISVCNSLNDFNNLKKITKDMKSWDDIVAVISPSLVKKIDNRLSVNSNPIRLCINRGLIDCSAENLGIASSNGNWLVLGGGISNNFIWDNLNKALYKADKERKKLIYFLSPNDSKCSPFILIDSLVCKEVGGIKPKEHINIFICSTIKAFNIKDSLAILEKQNKNNFITIKGSDKRILEIRSYIYKNGRKYTFIDRLMGHHRRLQQLHVFINWLSSPDITTYLKAARIKNLIFFLVTLNRKSFAQELHHIRNEDLCARRFFIDLKEMKLEEKKRLDFLIKNPKETTIYIINRDRISTLKQLLRWFGKQGLYKIVLIDNDSKYPPLIKYLNSTDYQVIETMNNVGHTVPWNSQIIRLLSPNDFYVVTDPDVVPVLDSIDVISKLLEVHSKFPNHLKVGLGLNIDDLPDEYILKKEVIEWESQFWKRILDKGVYEASVDTTFALYKPYTYNYFLSPSLRTGHPYTARHLPWYITSSKPTIEDVFYKSRLDKNVNTWNGDSLPERYIKELSKKK